MDRAITARHSIIGVTTNATFFCSYSAWQPGLETYFAALRCPFGRSSASEQCLETRSLGDLATSRLEGMWANNLDPDRNHHLNPNLDTYPQTDSL